jgi:hypothetical protein
MIAINMLGPLLIGSFYVRTAQILVVLKPDIQIKLVRQSKVSPIVVFSPVFLLSPLAIGISEEKCCWSNSYIRPIFRQIFLSPIAVAISEFYQKCPPLRVTILSRAFSIGCAPICTVDVLHSINKLFIRLFSTVLASQCGDPGGTSQPWYV